MHALIENLRHHDVASDTTVQAARAFTTPEMSERLNANGKAEAGVALVRFARERNAPLRETAEKHLVEQERAAEPSGGSTETRPPSKTAYPATQWGLHQPCARGLVTTHVDIEEKSIAYKISASNKTSMNSITDSRIYANQNTRIGYPLEPISSLGGFRA